MSVQLQRLLDAIEADMSEEVGLAFVRVAARYFAATHRADEPVSTRLTPEALGQLFAGGPGAEEKSVAEVLEHVERDVVRQSNRLYHPRYMGHQVSAPLPAAVWTDAIIGALNQSVAVQEMSPAITMIEHRLVSWLCEIAGFQGGTGTLTSGGTEANFTAMLAARAAIMPGAWQNGITGPLPVILCGEHAHYAVTRAAAELGLGLNRAILVRSKDYRMDVDDLRAKVEQLRASGTPIMAIAATAGSTPTGSFDDLNAIADLCDQHGIWLHVDGAHGASALMSPTRRESVRGIERARSVAWDPHKVMLMPLSVGVLLMRDPADLDAAFQQKAPYLFQGQHAGRTWDQGARSFQCSRRADALKLWVALNRYGANAFGLLYDHLCDLTAHLHEALVKHDAFEPMHHPQSNILCFRFVGGDKDLDEFNLRLRTEYNTRGTGWITTTVLEGVRVLRVTLMNPRTTPAHLDELLDELSETARQLL